MAAKYRKKPVVIEAVQLDISDHDQMDEIIEWCNGRAIALGIAIDTLEGTMIADHKDWIIKGIKGEFYPCKPDIFAVSYELAE